MNTVLITQILTQIDIGGEFFRDNQGVGFGSSDTAPGYAALAGAIVNNFVVIGGVVMVGMIIYAGYMFIQGAGSGNPGKEAKGRDIILWAIVGFIIMFSSYWFLKVLGLTTGLEFTN